MLKGSHFGEFVLILGAWDGWYVIFLYICILLVYFMVAALEVQRAETRHKDSMEEKEEIEQRKRAVEHF